jgi:hypothetical protein
VEVDAVVLDAVAEHHAALVHLGDDPQVVAERPAVLAAFAAEGLKA